MLPHLEVVEPSGDDREWCANLMASTEPWLTLGRSVAQCDVVFNNLEYLLYIAKERSKPCGFILLQQRGVAGSPYIVSIAVAADYRGKGIGRHLIHYAERLFHGKHKHIFMCVSSFNERARRLYARLGYRPVGEFEDYIISGASEILLHKRLQ